MAFSCSTGRASTPDARVEGATLLDIAPTVLALLGLPAGEDMEGRVLVGAFDDPSQVPARIPSWEGVSGNDGRPSPATGEEDAAAAQAALRRLAELGYIDLPDEDAGPRRGASRSGSLLQPGWLPARRRPGRRRETFVARSDHARPARSPLLARPGVGVPRGGRARGSRALSDRPGTAGTRPTANHRAAAGCSPGHGMISPAARPRGSRPKPPLLTTR